jgi:hypothetical protein
MLGCIDKAVAFALPLPMLQAQLPSLNARVRPDGSVRYWFITLQEDKAGTIALQLPKAGKSLPLKPYEMALGGHGG